MEHNIRSAKDLESELDKEERQGTLVDAIKTYEIRARVRDKLEKEKRERRAYEKEERVARKKKQKMTTPLNMF